MLKPFRQSPSGQRQTSGGQVFLRTTQYLISDTDGGQKDRIGEIDDALTVDAIRDERQGLRLEGHALLSLRPRGLRIPGV
jgi:hypothetical protein